MLTVDCDNRQYPIGK